MHKLSNWPVSLDRNATAIDPFSISWSELNFYAFPPFSLIGAAIAKLRQEKFLGSYFFDCTTYDTFSSKCIDFTNQKISKTPTLFENEVISRSRIRESFGNTNLPRETTQMLSQIRGEQPPDVGTNQFSGDGLFIQLQGT